MYGFGSLTSVLTLLVFLSACTTGNSQTDSANRIKMECQNSLVKLKCVNKSYLLTIVSVFYGRTQPGFIVCPSPRGSHLTDEIICDGKQNDVIGAVKRICEGRNSCGFTANKENLGADRCPYVFKYIYVTYNCVDSQKFKRERVVERPIVLTSSVVMATSSIPFSPTTLATSHVTSTETIRPTSTLFPAVETLASLTQSQYPRSRSHSSSVSATTVSHTQRFSVPILRSPTLTSANPASNTAKNRETEDNDSMKVFRFILGFHIIREESIHKHTASSVLWFLFGVLVGLLVTIVVLVYYRVKQSRNERDERPMKAAYVKQKDFGEVRSFEEKVILHSKELDALEMESQLGESV